MTKGLFKGIKCEICKAKARCIIRTKYVCKLCYSLIIKDNFKKHKQDIEITKDITILRICSRYKCKNKVIGPIETAVQEGRRYIRPVFCCNECREIEIAAKLKRGL